ncbi:MAG: MarC family NAAT transporter [Bacteroidota bacterium]
MLALGTAVFASLFSVVNPFGAVPVFLAMTPDHTRSERRTTAKYTSFYFALILISFFLAGTYILSFFGISLDAMRIAGGLVILASGFTLLSGKIAEGRAVGKKVQEEAIQKEDISFAPMAMPMLAGPGSISLLIGLGSEHTLMNDKVLIIGVILFTAAAVYGILRVAPMLQKVLGQAGINAISRIMGFLVMAIGIQLIIVGIVSLVSQVLNV